MQLDEINSRMSSFIDQVTSFYKSQGRTCALLASNVMEGESYSMDFLIDRRLVIRCSLPIDKRNFYAVLLIGIGPHFVHPMMLMEYEEASRYSMDDGVEFVMRNFRLLDEHLERGILQLFNVMARNR